MCVPSQKSQLFSSSSLPFSSFLSHPRPSKPFHASSSHYPSTKHEPRERLNEQPCFIRTSLQIARVKAHDVTRNREEKRRETRLHLIGGGDMKEAGGGEGRWLKDKLDDFLRRHPRNTGIGEHENSCNQFSPALAHEPHRVMQYNMWKRASPSNPMSSHPIP